MPDPTVSAPVVDALALLRNVARTGPAHQLALVYPVLCELAGLALMRMMAAQAMTADETITGQSGQPSHDGLRDTQSTARVHDRWISAKEGAQRLGVSMRTLRRRVARPPYSAFCIPQPHGFKISEVALDEFMRRARDRAR